jgi:hypothetical protein
VALCNAQINILCESNSEVCLSELLSKRKQLNNVLQSREKSNQICKKIHVQGYTTRQARVKQYQYGAFVPKQ